MADDHPRGPEPRHELEYGIAAAGNPWLIQLDVYLEDDECDPPKFRIESYMPSYEHKGETYFVFNNNHRPGFNIIFQLHDLTGKGYMFPRDPNQAIWSKIGETCPDESWGKNEVFTPKRVSQPNQTELVVYNENDKKDGSPIGKFRYTLNVSKTGQKPYLALDPGGDDQNGVRAFVSR